MMKPNWFDEAFVDSLAKATADKALAAIAKHPKIVAAVKKSLADYDKNSKKSGWAGPSRTQAIRTALAEVLQAS